MMLDGTLCECCGTAMEGEPTGFPSYCSAQCAEDRGFFAPPLARKRNKIKRQPATAPGSDKTACPTCGKKVKRHGLADHLRDKHGETEHGNA
jgi:endogenous inhibitor of DNA gyrase (YacG/DUF329 family)